MNGLKCWCALIISVAATVGCRESDSDRRDNNGEEVVFNLSDGMNMLLSAGEIPMLEQAAASGDNEAAKQLANHYSQTGQLAEEVRWLTVAANRDDCNSMSLLRSHARRAGDQEAASRWNRMMRQHECTLGKAHPGRPDPERDSVPLWDEE